MIQDVEQDWQMIWVQDIRDGDIWQANIPVHHSIQLITIFSRTVVSGTLKRWDLVVLTKLQN